jgi:hypothetical protein
LWSKDSVVILVLITLHNQWESFFELVWSFLNAGIIPLARTLELHRWEKDAGNSVVYTSAKGPESSPTAWRVRVLHYLLVSYLSFILSCWDKAKKKTVAYKIQSKASVYLGRRIWRYLVKWVYFLWELFILIAYHTFSTFKKPLYTKQNPGLTLSLDSNKLCWH